MRVATWNVNSIRSRLDQLTAWMARSAPDVVCMQETKVEDDIFPRDALGEVGYQVVFHGQKTYNGVAIAAKFGMVVDDVERSLGDEVGDPQARLIAASIEGIRIVTAYVPNGQAVGSPAFGYKLEWFERLRKYLMARHTPDQEVLVCGDFNVAPEPIDIVDPKKSEGNILFHPDERAAFQRLCDWGMVDVFRAQHPGEAGLYSWWDYRMGAYRKNRGARIDHILCTKPLAARVTGAMVDKRPRELERPSDHAPVIVELGPSP